MRTIPKWVDKIQDSEKVEQCIYDLCFNPDGSQLVVASGQRVLVYDTTDGTLIQPLRGHKDTVYCVAYARDGKRFASGSADKTVIIWSSKLEGVLKYSHSDAIQCLAYNPLSNQLASCALSDFGFWATEQKAVQKFKVNSRINSCSWTNDGQYLALGLGNGSVSIRNKLGEEKGRIDRTTSTNTCQIWALSWSPSKEDPSDILCVTDWNQSLTFYTLGGKLVGKERNIGFEALKVRYFTEGEYIMISGTNKACSIYTKEGIKLGTVGDAQQSWIWSCAAHPNSNYIALGCQDGTLAYYQLVFNTVHGLYRERYAFRENMTDVIIQHLLTEQKVRIKCRDFIKKIAIYKHRLAVQLPERIVIYELYSGDSNDMHYRVREKITQKLDCNLLVVCTKHLIVCQERKLQCMTFSGQKEREWVLDSVIRYIKVVGGPAGKEGLVLGLKSGQVWKIFLNNAFPIMMLTINAAVRCLDLSSERDKIAVVDENGLCQVFKCNNAELLFQEFNTNSVAWNTNYEDMLAFSGNNSLAIKVADFPAHKQKLNGFVVGLTGSQVFCLNGATMTTIDLPLSAPMYQYIDKRMFKEAYSVACLGVTNGDWEELANAALESLELDVAKQAFIRLQNYTYLELIQNLQEQQKKGDCSKEVLIADVLAFRGRFKEAARLYQKAGEEHRALTMYTDLRMFDLAQVYFHYISTLEFTREVPCIINNDYLGSGDHKNLIRQKAEWARNINEPKAAVDMYLSIGDTKVAIEIMGENGWTDQLIDLGRRLDKVDKDSLLAIAEHLKRLQQTGAAAELYRRLDDAAAVIRLHIEAREWAQAFALADQQPQHKALVYVPYAHWLAENDKFAQAQKAFHRAGRPEEAFKVLEQLTDNAVNEYRFQDAGYYYWILSQQCLDIARENPEREKEMTANFYKNERLASIYYAYHVVHRYLEEPFTSHMPEGIFNISRFLMNEIVHDKPKEISLFSILYTLSKQARILGANKLSKQLLDRIQSLKIPNRFLEQVEVSILVSKAKPFSDLEELLPMCYRCSTYNPLISNGNNCNNCGQKFVFSYVAFEILPLVEFELEEGISDTEAVRLIETPKTLKNDSENDPGWIQEVSDTHQTLQIDKNAKDPDSEDVFTEHLLNFESGDGKYIPLTVNRKTLLAMDSSTILISKWEPPLRFQYFRNLLPDVPVTICSSCFKVFHVDDFELQVLQKGFCPYCRSPPETYTSSETPDDLLSIY